MAMLDIDGIGKVEVGNDFLKLPPDKQAIEVQFMVDSLKPPTTAAATAQPQKSYANASIGDVAKEAVTNIPGSALQMAKDIAHVVVHPIDTAENIGAIGKGLLQKIGIISGQDSEKYADAVGQFFVDRYGSAEGIKKAVATDPVGVLSDVATILTGGGAAAARAPGVIGKVGEIAGTVGRAVDPLTAVGEAAKLAGKGAAQVVGNFGTHTGARPIIEAAQAGAEGGEAGRAFRDNLIGRESIADVVGEAKQAVAKLREERGAAYRSEMAKVGADNTVLNFDKVDDALTKVSEVKTYKGQDLSPTTQTIRADIGNEVKAWKALDSAEFHTAEGLDALKQKIGDIRDGTKYGTPERRVAETVYQSIRQTIIDQVPQYAKVMKGYEEASTLLREIESTLSLKPGANIDTALRKLQSVLHNNVNANFGRRAELADYLVSAGATNLLKKLAGQSLNSVAPRGIGKLAAASVAGAGGLLGAATGGVAPLALAAGVLPFTSPVLVGGAAHALGAASRVARPVSSAFFQTGRESRVSK